VSWQITPLAAPTVFAAVVAVAIAGYAVGTFRRGRRDRTVVLLFWIAVAAAAWTALSAAKLLHTDPAVKLLFYRLLHVPAAALPGLTFLFVAAYTDRGRWLSPRGVAAVFAVPALFVLLIATDPGGAVVAGTRVMRGELVVLRVEDGPAFGLFIAHSVAAVLAGSVISGREAVRVGRAYYPQAALLAVALLVPVGFAVATAVEIPPFVDDRVNLVPTAGAVSVVAVAALLGRYRLFDLPPLAYTTAMRYSPDPLLVLDGAGRVVHANERGERFLGRFGASLDERPRLTALLGEVSLEGTVGDDPEGGDKAAAGDERSVDGDPLAVPEGDAETAYYRPFVEPLVRGGYRAGWVVVLRDETEQERRRRELERQNDRMEAFAATVSHDLRNPLGVAQGFVDLAETADDPRDAFERVRSAHDRMESIITELLLLAREGQEIGDREAVDLDAAARTAWSHVETGSVTLTVATDETVFADPTSLQHVFENLFRNAIEHGGDGVTTVSVTGTDGGFTVEDDGVGLGDGAGETAANDDRDGGLGLGIVRTVVEAHGWAFEMTNGPNGGARAVFTGVEAVSDGETSATDSGR